MNNLKKTLILIIFLVSNFVIAKEKMILGIQEEIPEIFKNGMKEVLNNYDIIELNISKNACISNECLAQMAQKSQSSNIIIVKVFNGDKLQFKAKFIDFKNQKIVVKERYFEINDENALYLFSKKYAENIIGTSTTLSNPTSTLSSHKKGIEENKYEPLVGFEKTKRKHQNIREKYNLGVTVGLGGSNFLGINLDLFITEYINIEISTILYIPMVLGINFFFTPKDNRSIYLGVHSVLVLGVAPNEYYYYFPIGIQYISPKSGFTFDAELGVVIWGTHSIIGSGILPWGGIKLGYHF